MTTAYTAPCTFAYIQDSEDGPRRLLAAIEDASISATIIEEGADYLSAAIFAPEDQVAALLGALDLSDTQPDHGDRLRQVRLRPCRRPRDAEPKST